MPKRPPKINDALCALRAKASAAGRPAAEMLARMERRVGQERLAAALARAQRGGGALAEARMLAAEGRMPEALARVVAVLASGPAASGSPRLAAARSALAACGWEARWEAPSSRAQGILRSPEGDHAGRIVVCGGQGRPVADLNVLSRVAGAAEDTVSITPTVRLEIIPRKALSKREDAGLKRLAASLYPILESLRGQAAGRRVKAQAEIHETGDRPEAIVRTTFACNQRCPFCFVPHESRMVPFEEIERELDAVAAQAKEGAALTFSGGEPLVDPRLAAVLESARRRGMRGFVLQTNMIGLDKPGAVERLFALGVTGYDVSFHSHKSAAYDRITGSKGLLPRAVQALRRILAVPSARVTACILINKHNYRDLPGLMGFLGRLSREHRADHPLEVSFAVMNGAGMDRASFMAADLAQAAPHVWKAVQRCKAEGIVAQRFTGESALPPCIMPRPQDYCSQSAFSQDRVRYADDFSGELGTVGSAKKPGCLRCPYDSMCLGVPAQYARLFGLGALRPPRKSPRPRR
ncbi:MAG: radical SAM protein [Elusimicrobia bacterium]|nr:radical SAM protein [Elusimicrobiota bacterium]